MQKDRNHDVGPYGLLEPSLNHDAASSNGFQPTAKMRDRLEKLAKWRIEQSSIEFPKDTCEFKGGNATVSRAFLASPGGKESTNHSDPTQSKGLDSGDPAGETPRRLKAVAVKKMKMSGDLKRVLGLTVREAEFLVGLSHENVIELEGFVEDVSKEIIWLVFPWEDNGTLKDFITSTDWEIPERINLISDVAGGVEYLHSRQPPICHGDLKSINVLVNPKCRAVITDFGSARRIKTDNLSKETKPAQNEHPAALSLEALFCASTNTITLTGDQYTLRWAAPELFREEDPSLRSDIWALGWVAYEVMTNNIPFQDVRAEFTVVTRVIQGKLPSLTEHDRMSLIQALCSVMLLCWSIEPSKRPTAEEFRKSIGWMPKIIPNPVRTSDPAASPAHSPELLVKLGDMYVRQGDYLRALDFFAKAVDGYTDTGDKKGKAAALVQTGQVHRFQSEFDQAIPFYSEALQIFTDVGDRTGRADPLFGLAEVHRVKNEYGQAIPLYSEVLQIRTDIGDERGRADALDGLAEVHRVQGEHSQAITFYSEALKIRTELGDSRGRADDLWGLAEVHRLRSEYGQAITFYSEALRIRTDIGDRRGRAKALSGLAEVHRARGEYSQASEFYSEALQIYTEIGDKQGRADVLSYFATVHRLRNEHSQAITFYSEALQIRTDVGDRRGRASTLWSLAQVHRARKEYSEAISLYSEALQISTDISDRIGRAAALNGLAGVHRIRNEHSQAITFYSEDLQIRNEIGDRKGKAQALRGLAHTHQCQNEFSQAITLFSEALQISTDIDDRYGRALALQGLAGTCHDQEDAIRLYTEATQIFIEIGLDNYASASYYALLRRLLTERKPDDASEEVPV